MNDKSIDFMDSYIGYDIKEDLKTSNSFINLKEIEDHMLYSGYSFLSSNISEVSINNNMLLNNIQEDFGFWNNLKKNFSDLKNKIKFNILHSDNYVDFDRLVSIQIYDTLFNLNDRNEYAKMVHYIRKEIIWMSYRCNFEPIIYNNSTYTSDAGWGCMIRAGQMIVAKGMYEVERTDNFEDILMLFGDNPVKMKDLTNNPYLNYYRQNYISPDLYIKCKKPSQCREEYECISKNNKVTGKINLNTYVTPPFSIRNILNTSIRMNKGAGDWFSDQDIIKIFIELNKKYTPIENLKIIHFSEGTIYLEELIKLFFQIKFCNCKNSRVSFDYDRFDYKTIDLQEDDDYVIIDNFVPIPDQCKCFLNCFYYNNNYYELLNPFLLFVSLRLGLDKLEESYYDSVLNCFDVNNNLGLIGGKGSRALYFVGRSDRNLIFLDPHFVQESRDLSEKNDKNINRSSYTPQNYYSIGVEQMTPSITAGFHISIVSEFISLLCDLKNKASLIIKLSEYKK